MKDNQQNGNHAVLTYNTAELLGLDAHLHVSCLEVVDGKKEHEDE